MARTSSARPEIPVGPGEKPRFPGFWPLGERVRDVRVGPDDNLYVLTDEEDGKLLRIQPPKAP